MHQQRHLISMLRHEINNYLALISSELQLLTVDYPELLTHSGYHQIMQDLTHIQTLLTNTAADHEPFQVYLASELLTSVYQTCMPLAQIHDITLKLNIQSDASIYIQWESMRRVLINLIKNAIEASKSGQTIHLSCNCQHDELRFLIIDHGCGIPTELKATIYQPFVTTKSSGTGTGLFVAKETIQKQNGRLYFESDISTGTTFYLFLPVATKQIE